MSSCQWYINRLRQMSMVEIIYRVKTFLVVRLQKKEILVVNNPPVFKLNSNNKEKLIYEANVEKDRYIKSGEDLINGKLSIFSLVKTNYWVKLNWNRDPKSEIISPLEFGKSLDYRNSNLCGDIKYIWEPNRHLHLVTLAQSYKLTGDVKYLQVLSQQLQSWFTQCPYNRGPNWTSSLELGIRLINWSLVWDLIGGEKSPVFDGVEGKVFLNDWLMSIYQHCHFIKNHFSRFSSANNHLIGEASGLFIGTTVWPYWNEFKKWQKIAYKELCIEAVKQNHFDGVNKEQAISYQQFVLDFLLLSGLAGKRNNLNFPESYWSVIEKMLEYLASVMDVSGNVPMIGDADDGYVTKLSQEENFCPYRSLLATGAILFSRSDFKVKAQKLDDKTRWLFGDSAEKKFNELDANQVSLPVHHQFPDGGYCILGSDFETKQEIRLIVDAGPLGYTNIAAHGHADSLSFTLSIGGKEFLIDTGTYSYHTQQKWRDYFRGTSAHNTVRIDKVDQSVSGGNFMWLDKAVSKCEKWVFDDDSDIFIGSHNGYMRLSDPVMHRREIKLDKKTCRIRIVDSIICKEKHIAEQFWHFSEQCLVELSRTEILVRNADKSIKIRIHGESVKIRSFKGDEDLPSGWVSRSFDVKLPTTSVVVATEIDATTMIQTEIIY